jgi:hypothetical protein
VPGPRERPDHPDLIDDESPSVRRLHELHRRYKPGGDLLEADGLLSPDRAGPGGARVRERRPRGATRWQDSADARQCGEQRVREQLTHGEPPYLVKDTRTAVDPQPNGRSSQSLTDAHQLSGPNPADAAGTASDRSGESRAGYASPTVLVGQPPMEASTVAHGIRPVKSADDESRNVA